MSRQVKEISLKSYVATAPFHNDFFTYTVTTDRNTFKKTGALVANVAGATASTCPAGRILRENGRKLYPSAHDGVRTLMVGVFDNQSMLSGFIDPNSPEFAVYNTDRPNYLVDAVDPAGGLTDQGPPVKTNGGVAVGPSGTLLTKILKGSNLATTSTLPGPTHAAGSPSVNYYNIGDVYDLEFTVAGVTVNDSIIVNQVANFPGWVVTSSWPKVNGFVVKVFATGTHTNGTVPLFNYTIIQS
jgi:hypothetical protein